MGRWRRRPAFQTLVRRTTTGPFTFPRARAIFPGFSPSAYNIGTINIVHCHCYRRSEFSVAAPYSRERRVSPNKQGRTRLSVDRSVSNFSILAREKKNARAPVRVHTQREMTGTRDCHEKLATRSVSRTISKLVRPALVRKRRIFLSFIPLPRFVHPQTRIIVACAVRKSNKRTRREKRKYERILRAVSL